VGLPIVSHNPATKGFPRRKVFLKRFDLFFLRIFFFLKINYMWAQYQLYVGTKSGLVAQNKSQVQPQQSFVNKGGNQMRD